MGDRFYQQQTGQTMGALAQPRRRAIVATTRSKADMAKQIGISGIDKLLVPDLLTLTLLNLEGSSGLLVPEGRLKKPYIEVCNSVNSDIDWSKLTVATLKEVIALL